MNIDDDDDLFDDEAIEQYHKNVIQHQVAQANAYANGGAEDELTNAPANKYAGLDIEVEDEEDAGTVLNMKGKSVQEVLGLAAQGANVQGYDHAVRHYEMDMDTYLDMFNMSQVMQDSVGEGMTELPVFDKLNADIFFSLFKYKPQIRRVNDMKNSTRINNVLMKKLIDTPEYRQLRQTCKLDLFNSAMATEIIGQKAIEIIKDWKQKEADALAAAGKDPNSGIFGKIDKLQAQEDLQDELIDKIVNIDEIIEQMKQQGGNVDELVEMKSQGMYDLQTAMQIANQLADELEEDILEEDGLIEDVTMKISESLTTAEEEVAEISEMIDQWGFDSGKNNVRIPFGSKRKAAERIRHSAKLKDLADLIGKLKDSAMRDQKHKSKMGATAIKTVTTGNKVEGILPSEKLKLGHETTKKDFYRKYNQKELLVYEYENTNKKNKGPMIVCVDTSGSMDETREKWSKAMAVALLEVAQTQKRNFACILFDTKIQGVYIIEKGEMDPNKVVDIAENFSGGGTDFVAPLNKALDIIKDNKFKGADIVFITDGDCGIPDDFVKKFNRTKEEKDFQCMSVLIDFGGGSRSKKTLELFSDDVLQVSKIAELTSGESEIAHKIFGAV